MLFGQELLQECSGMQAPLVAAVYLAAVAAETEKIMIGMEIGRM